MTYRGDDPPPGPSTANGSIVEYALLVTDTVVWDWHIPSDDIVLYPSSQDIFEEIRCLDDFIVQVHPEDRDDVAEALEEALEETGSYTTEFRLATATECWISAQGQVEYDDTGEPKRMTGVGREVSDRKSRDAEFRRLYEHLTETEYLSEMGGWELEISTNQVRWTTGTRRIHEVDSDFEPTLEDALDFYHPEDRPTIERAVGQCIEYGEPFDVNLRLITAEGRERWVFAKGERVRRGDTMVLRGVIQDITDRRIRDQRLLVLNRVLRHNIRNSLGVVLGNTELLREDLESLEPIENQLSEAASFSLDDALATTSTISKNADNLVELAEEARRLSDALSHGSATYYVELTPLVERLVSTFTEQYPAASITIDGTEAGVRGNGEALEMALRELIENAVVHTGAPDPMVEISHSRVERDRVRIQVADDGPGIPDMEREVLERGVEEPLLHGRGLGLWIVNWLTVKMGGSVSIREKDPTGTVVALTLPAAMAG